MDTVGRVVIDIYQSKCCVNYRARQRDEDDSDRKRNRDDVFKWPNQIEKVM